MLPDAVTQVKPLADTLVAQGDSLLTTAKTLAAQVDTAAADAAVKVVGDTLANVVPQVADSLLAGAADAAAKLKRDTTTMDSLELAIYKYNKVIDDSLRLDSLNRQKKNGTRLPLAAPISMATLTWSIRTWT